MNILGLNRLLKFVSNKWASKLFTSSATYVRDLRDEVTKAVFAGLAGARLGLWFDLVHLHDDTGAGYGLLLLHLGRLLRLQQARLDDGGLVVRVEFLHSVHHQPHSLRAAHTCIAQEGKPLSKRQNAL